MLDPDAAELRARLLAANLAPVETLTPADARAMLTASRARAGLAGPPLHEVRDLSVGRLAMRLYRPCPDTLPCVLFLHGGGWVLGDLDSHDALCRHVAAAAGVAVLAVDYRLAPEHRFPAAVDDALAAFAFLGRAAAGCGIDPARIAVMGDSAGGNLATVLAVAVRGSGLPKLRLQILAYPITEVTLDQPSQTLNGPGWTLTGAGMRWFRDLYLGDATPDWRCAPLRADPTGSAPALILTAGVDPLADEGIAYAGHMARHGVRVEHRHYPGQMHGFLTAGLAGSTAQSEIARIAQRLREELFHD